MRLDLSRAAVAGAFAVTSTLGVSCAGEPSGGGWSGAFRDSAGVVVVENPGTGVWRRGGGPGVREVLRIGVAEGEPEYQFGEIAAVNVDAEGWIYVGDRLAREIRVYDPAGRFERRIGGPGAGPGELGAGGTGIHFGRGDTVIVPDPGLQRINFFSRDGRFLRSHPLSSLEGISRGWAAVPDSGLLQHLRRLSIPGWEGAGEADVVVRRGWDGAIRDTVLVLPRVAGPRLGDSGVPTMTLFAPEPVWGVAGDGRIFSALDSEYRIEVRSLDRTIRRVIRRRFEPQRVAAADRELLLGHIRERIERLGAPPAGVAAVLDGVVIADHYPVIAALLEGPEGSLWVQKNMTVRRAVEVAGAFHPDELGSPEWDIFDREGRYLGVITLPHRFQPHLIRGDRIYGVAKDELDVPYVVVLELVGEFGADLGEVGE